MSRYPVVIIGARPAGLTAGYELIKQGMPLLAAKNILRKNYGPWVVNVERPGPKNFTDEMRTKRRPTSVGQVPATQPLPTVAQNSVR